MEWPAPELAVPGRRRQHETDSQAKENSDIQRYKNKVAELQKEVQELRLTGTDEKSAGSSTEKVLKSQLFDLHNQCDKKDHIIDDLYKRCDEQILEIDQNKIQIKQLQDCLQKSRDEVNTLTSRLGMQVGDKVMDNGQDKADLSDPFRPTRIGQDFSDLFDNEWSDAFEEMAFKDDDCKVRFLLLIMESAYNYCDKVNKNQIQGITCMLEGTDIFQATTLETETNTNRSQHTMLREIRRSFSETAAANVSKSFSKSEFLDLCKMVEIRKPGPHLSLFGVKCAQICWYMLVYDPPMALETCRKGDRYQDSRHRAYTRSDRAMVKAVVEFPVWPALLLHEEGPVVTRGVVQPVEGQSRTTN